VIRELALLSFSIKMLKFLLNQKFAGSDFFRVPGRKKANASYFKYMTSPIPTTSTVAGE